MFSIVAVVVRPSSNWTSLQINGEVNDQTKATMPKMLSFNFVKTTDANIYARCEKQFVYTLLNIEQCVNILFFY